MTTPSDPRHGGQPMGQPAPRGPGAPGAPGGYGPPPGYGQYPDGNAADWRGQQGSQGPPPGAQPPAYPPPANYGGPPPGYGGPAGYPNGPQGYQQQPSGFPPPAQKPVPPGAPGPIPEWWERFVARFLDGLLFVIISMVLSGVVGAAFTPSTAEIIANGFQLGYGYYLAMAVVSLATGALYAGYDVIMHSRNGQTLGKMALKTRLVALNGAAPDQASLIKRAAVYPASGFVLSALFLLIPGFPSVLSTIISLGYGVALGVLILTDTLGRGLQDKWSNTIVVKA